MIEAMTTTTEKTMSNSLTLRPGTVADSYDTYKVFEETLADLLKRLGSKSPTSWQDPQALARMWEERHSMFEYLAKSAEHFWVAEREGQIVGYARSILNDGHRELTELFVVPAEQSTGVGRELLARTFPPEGATDRSIIATSDYRAQALYMSAGVYPRFPIYYFERTPEPVSGVTNLAFEPISASAETFDRLAQIDIKLLGYWREAIHAWLLEERQGYLYYRDDRPVGYGYLGPRNGPFALLDDSDYPAVLAHAESEAARKERPFGLEVPTINQTAMSYLLARGFKMDSFVAIFMSDVPFGKFQNYIFPSPPFFS